MGCRCEPKPPLSPFRKGGCRGFDLRRTLGFALLLVACSGAEAAWAGLPVIEAPVSVRYFGSERVSHFRPFVDFCRNSETFARLITRRVLLGGASRRR